MKKPLWPASILFALGLAQSAMANPAEVTVVIKFLKKTNLPEPVAKFAQTSCQSCKSLLDPDFAKNNFRETVLALSVPKDRNLALAFNAQCGEVRRVILESDDLNFQCRSGHLELDLPPLSTDAVGAADMHTLLFEPGLVTRIEHDDVERRDGFYTDRTAYFVERKAATNLTFAQREVIRLLGLGTYVEREGLGKILLMGFDTNNPHGHRDAPPHMHMHLRWPKRAGTQIGHFYINSSGLLTENTAGVQKLNVPAKTYRRGEAFTTIDSSGNGLYTHTITPEGWLTLGRAGEAPCLLNPKGKGFDTGVVIKCPGASVLEVTTEDDLGRGRLTVRINNTVEVIHYDPDTGEHIAFRPRMKDRTEEN